MSESAVNIPYAAGIIDSRGHIELVQRHEQSAPRVRVTTRRSEIVEWLALHTGTTVHRDQRGYQRRGCSQHCAERHQHIDRQSSYWNVDAARAVIVLYNVLPYTVCATSVAVSALAQARDSWPTRPRTEISEAMKRFGWRIPRRSDLPAIERARG